MPALAEIPLSLYVHIPWCVKKCPYCDFNSHQDSDPPWPAYVDALLIDLERDYAQAGERQINSIFFGGGTPSLMPGKWFKKLMEGIRARVELANACEVTLEANPGSLDAENFENYRAAGANRLSIGAQSFRNQQLQELGRVHRADAIVKTYLIARSVGFENINLDLMHSLPNDSGAGTIVDLNQAISLQPEHISWYELTLEEGTQFAIKPPLRPRHEEIISKHEDGVELLRAQGYMCYEVSAFARAGYQCRHNENYWQFGDYIGIGAGAHGKNSADDCIYRTAKRRSPNGYLMGVATGQHQEPKRVLAQDDLICEFMINATRLRNGFKRGLFEQRTGLDWKVLDRPLRSAAEKGFLTVASEQVCLTAKGQRFLNDLQLLFC